MSIFGDDVLAPGNTFGELSNRAVNVIPNIYSKNRIKYDRIKLSNKDNFEH